MNNILNPIEKDIFDERFAKQFLLMKVNLILCELTHNIF